MADLCTAVAAIDWMSNYRLVKSCQERCEPVELPSRNPLTDESIITSCAASSKVKTIVKEDAKIFPFFREQRAGLRTFMFLHLSCLTLR